MRRPRVELLAPVAIAAAALLSVPADGSPAVGQATVARFACYPAQFSAFRPQRLLLLDRVALRLTVSLDVPESMCAPARGLSGRVGGSTSYLTCYRISGSSSFSFKTVRSSDEFGRASIRLFRPISVCASSARVDEGGSSVPAKAPAYFTCYSSKAVRALARTGVTIGDAFGSSEDAVRGPLRVCSPAARKGSLLPERRYLVCYGVTSTTKGPTVIVRNDFGFLKGALGPREQLCVAATVL